MLSHQVKVGSGAGRPDFVDDPPGLALSIDAKLAQLSTDREPSEPYADARVRFEPGNALRESLDDGCQPIIGPCRSP